MIVCAKENFTFHCSKVTFAFVSCTFWDALTEESYCLANDNNKHTLELKVKNRRRLYRTDDCTVRSTRIIFSSLK